MLIFLIINILQKVEFFLHNYITSVYTIDIRYL